MENKPYFCPNCRSNRYKFSLISSYSQPFKKDAVTGVVLETQEAVRIDLREPEIQCLVCDFIGNELRFIKQAAREPRVMTETNPSYV